MRSLAIGLAVLVLSLVQGERPFPAPQSSKLNGDPWAIPSGRLAQPVPAIQRVLIISIDGMRPDVLLRANTPNLHQLFQEGCFTFWAKTTYVSVTLPSHTSMLTGVPPSRHGIVFNGDVQMPNGVYPAVPTLFELARRAGYTTAMVAGKAKFAALAKPGTLDWMYIAPVVRTLTTPPTTDAQVADEAVKIIREHAPQVLFVHLPSVDGAGHRWGWGTPQQISAAEGADSAVGRVLAALKEQGLLESTFVLVSADHGGQGRTHGPEDARSRHIPWIVCGPGIRKNVDLTGYPMLTVNTEDTFATVCWLLGIPTARNYLTGKPITEIIERTELLHSLN